MPTPTIPAGNLFMNATLVSGITGGTQTIINGAAGQSFQPDLVWNKTRSVVDSNYLNDSVRGAANYLVSNTTAAEASNANFVASFNSNGFSYGTGGYTTSQPTVVAWQWKAGGTAVSNTSGTITSQVSANTTSGFSVVTYTGNGSAGATVGHGLGVAPAMIIVKKRSSTGNWITYHTSTGINQYLYLNSTSASATATPTWGVSSTTFTLQQSFTDYNDNGVTYVAYCWSQIAGFSQFGSYTGNGSADGPFIYTGFRPRFIMWKRTDTANDWIINDTSRDTYNAMQLNLLPDSSQAESTAVHMDALSNGFKIRASSADVNASAGTYIYACFAENPFKYANAR